MTPLLRDALNRWLPPSIVIVVVLTAWAGVTASGAVSPLLLPAPMQVVEKLFQDIASGAIFPHIAYTMSNVAIGFVIGSAIAIAFAVLIAASPLMEALLVVHVVAFQSIPKVSLAPLIFVWVGFGAESSIVLIALVCFFPVFMNTLSGLRAVDGNLIALYRALGASRWRIAQRVMAPAAMPAILTGLQIALIFSLLASVVMEFMTGAKGLGFLIEQSSVTWDTPQVFSALIVLAVIGVAMSTVLRRIRRTVLFWETPERRTLIAEV